MNQSLGKIRNIINSHRLFLKDNFKVKSISIFGSYIRNEQHDKSDIDILVEFYKVIDLFKFIELEYYLSEILGCKVDLVMKDTLKPRIKNIILNEAVTI